MSRWQEVLREVASSIEASCSEPEIVLRRLNSNCRLRPADLGRFIRIFKPDVTAQELDVIFRNANSSGSGELDLAEFAEMLGYRSKQNQCNIDDLDLWGIVARVHDSLVDLEVSPKTLFQQLSGGSGFIGHIEIERMVSAYIQPTPLHGVQMQRIVRHFDPRHTGQVDLLDFCQGLGFPTRLDNTRAVVSGDPFRDLNTDSFVQQNHSLSLSTSAISCGSQRNLSQDFTPSIMGMESVQSHNALFFVAAKQGQVEVMHRLLHDATLKIDIDTRDVEGNTPLIYAAQNGHTVAAEFLVDAGADVFARDDAHGYTASEWAGTRGNTAIAAKLNQAISDCVLLDRCVVDDQAMSDRALLDKCLF